MTDRATIEARLAQTAAEGIAYSRDEYRKGASAVAVPIFSRGDVVASVGLIVPSERFEDNLERYTLELRTAADTMGRRLDEGAGRPPDQD